MEAWLDADDKAGRLASRAPREIASALKGELARLGLKVGPIDRGLPKEPFAAIAFGLVIFGYAIVGWPAPLIARLFYEPRDRREAKENPPKIKSDLDPYVCSIMDSEDLSPQNGLTHIVPVKPGRFRRGVLTFVLSFVECARSLLCFRGNLDGIETIHFARWVLLDDGTLVFFSNYDGSWESYLGDFVEQGALVSHRYLDQHEVVPEDELPRLRRRVGGGRVQAVGADVPGEKPDLVLGLPGPLRRQRLAERPDPRARRAPAPDRPRGAGLARARLRRIQWQRRPSS